MLKVTLTEDLQAYVEALVDSGEYSTPIDYIHDLIRHDRDAGWKRGVIAEERFKQPR